MLPLILKGARLHNLKGVDLDLEPGTVTAIVGRSGAGKSSLAFGTLYAEGQRRYVESFSPYARQFLERLPRPPFEQLDSVPPGIAVDRRAPIRTSRSTVGSMSEIADYAKSLWARLAIPTCPTSGDVIEQDTAERGAERVLRQLPGQRVLVAYPVTLIDREHFLKVREDLLADGFRRVLVGGKLMDLDDVKPSVAVAKLKKPKASKLPVHPLCRPPVSKPQLWVVTDRTKADKSQKTRLVESLELALARGAGSALVVTPDGAQVRVRDGRVCATCDRRVARPREGLFSFNSPLGACPACRGFGRVMAVDLDRVLPNQALSLSDGAVAAWSGKSSNWERRKMLQQAEADDVRLDVPVEDLSPRERKWLLDGDGSRWPRSFGGIRPWFKWLESRAYKMHVRVFLSRYRKYERCGSCQGNRLIDESLTWTINAHSIADFLKLPICEARQMIEELPLPKGDTTTATLKTECTRRLAALDDIGLGYLTLDRHSRTLSGGEAQRVSLTTALGASLTQALFVLDEPTAGLHPADVGRLTRSMRQLADGGNTVVVVEHDLDVIRAADRVVEIGPESGKNGGRLIFDGTPAKLKRAKTATGAAMRKKAVVVAAKATKSPRLSLTGASGNNLSDVRLDIPRRELTCITGLSGSGKSSLVVHTLMPAVQRSLGLPPSVAALAFDKLTGAGGITSIELMSQAPLGRTSRGNPATYLKVWNRFRDLLARQPLAKERGYVPGTFSFNVEGGRCDACAGQGHETVEMQFLADVTFSCAVCHGERFKPSVLEVTIEGYHAAQLLELTAKEALEIFADEPKIVSPLSLICDIGLGYLTLGQPLNTLSGGEAQRVKLASILSARKRKGEEVLYILDEPTVGLHPSDVEPLIVALRMLRDEGHTVIVIEHDMTLAAQADHLIEMGPGAGHRGGMIVAEGRPAELAKSEQCVSSPYLARALGAVSAIKAKATKRARPKGRKPWKSEIEVRGARENNLSGIDLVMPRQKLIVVTGPSGSGKSSLVFDTVFAEGQRRFVDTLSPYARQYLPQLPRPDVDQVIGVPPTVSLEQRRSRSGSNSTVATVTEVAHFLRLLYARLGEAPALDATAMANAISPQKMVREVRKRLGARSALRIYAPVVRGRKGHHQAVLEKARVDGFAEARIDGKIVRLKEGLKLSRHKEHDIDLMVQRVRATDQEAVLAAIRAAAQRADGGVRVASRRGQLMADIALTSGRLSSRLDPRLFSFNTRHGHCTNCEGRGEVVRKVGRGRKALDVRSTCPECEGTRLSRFARSVKVLGCSIDELMAESIGSLLVRLAPWRFDGDRAAIAAPILGEVRRRLEFLVEVGVGYLTLDRAADTLSGGETQRVRLAAQLGSGLTGVLYVLDEPTIGLHPQDTQRLIATLRRLVDQGNSLLVVEHDLDTISEADHVIDLGPGGGSEGGRVMAQGTLAEVAKVEASPTGRLLRAPPPAMPKKRTFDAFLSLKGASLHNLKNVAIKIPHGALTVVTGVSGSGKTTLLRRVLLPSVRDALGLVSVVEDASAKVSDLGDLQRAVEVDQTPIGRTPRSVPATYIKIWDQIRALLAKTPEARARGYAANRFSFNVGEGRCAICEGNGEIRIEMSFLPDTRVPCDECDGARFSEETLMVRYRGLHAGDILKLEVERAVEVFAAFPKIVEPLKRLAELGLGYLRLGQPSSTLSGGEAQRLKLVAELGKRTSTRTLYILDEPTTGLHGADVARLMGLLTRLRDRGDTVVVIEHHPRVMLGADWIIDLGPGGGALGGQVVVSGPVAKVVASKKSVTAEALVAELNRGQR